MGLASLPTFGCFFIVHVGKYTIHGSYLYRYVDRIITLLMGKILQVCRWCDGRKMRRMMNTCCSHVFHVTFLHITIFAGVTCCNAVCMIYVGTCVHIYTYTNIKDIKAITCNLSLCNTNFMFYWHITVLTCKRYLFLRLHLALWLTFWFYKKRHVKTCREHAKKTFHHPVWSRLASRLLFPSRSPIIFLKLWWVVSFFKVEIMKLSTAHQPVIGEDYFSAFQMLRELPGVLFDPQFVPIMGPNWWPSKP